MVWTKLPKACRQFGQELFATCSEGVRTLAERPNQKPWGGFESKARKANEGCSSHIIFISKAKEIRISSESSARQPLRFLRYLLFKKSEY